MGGTDAFRFLVLGAASPGKRIASSLPPYAKTVKMMIAGDLDLALKELGPQELRQGAANQ